MKFDRSSGILMNISSLPSKYGIGVFSDDVVKFGKFVLSCGAHYWQMLPLTTIGTGNSPYSGVSAFAGNFLYIDADKLVRDGVITAEDAKSTYYKGSMYTVDYATEYLSRRTILAKAVIKGYPKYKDEIDAYLLDNSWLVDYAEYMTLKEVNANTPWWQWNEKLKMHDRGAIDEAISKNRSTYEYYIYEQFVFDRQWREVKSSLNSMGISIIGDMPIYVSLDSSDVWSHQEMFDHLLRSNQAVRLQHH